MYKPGTSCVEGVHRFNFEAGYLVCRCECSPFYSRHAQNFCNSCKEMDFILYHPGKKELWLIEVKDYRFNARPKVRELVEKLCRKVRDSLFLLRTAALAAPEEEPPEGVSLREIARQSLQAKHIRVAFTIELGNTGLFPPKALLSTIRDLLYRQICFIDPQMMCLPITESGGVGPWTITPAGDEHSARIQRRMEEARLAREREEKRRREQAVFEQREQARHMRRRRKSPCPSGNSAPRSARRKSGTHADRKNRLPEYRPTMKALILTMLTALTAQAFTAGETTIGNGELTIKAAKAADAASCTFEVADRRYGRFIPAQAVWQNGAFKLTYESHATPQQQKKNIVWRCSDGTKSYEGDIPFRAVPAGKFPAVGKLKVACVGDSITFGLGINQAENKYPEQLQKILGEKFEVGRFGNSAKTAARVKDGVWYGLQREHRQALDFKADLYISNLGINDTNRGTWDTERCLRTTRSSSTPGAARRTPPSCSGPSWRRISAATTASPDSPAT